MAMGNKAVQYSGCHVNIYKRNRIWREKDLRFLYRRDKDRATKLIYKLKSHDRHAKAATDLREV